MQVENHNSVRRNCRELIASYCEFRDLHSWNKLADLFTLDAQFEVNGTLVVGRSAISQFLANRASTPTFHLPSSINVTPMDEAVATVKSRVVVLSSSDSSSGRSDGIKLSLAALYHDRIVLDEGTWRFACRKATIILKSN